MRRKKEKKANSGLYPFSTLAFYQQENTGINGIFQNLRAFVFS